MRLSITGSAILGILLAFWLAAGLPARCAATPDPRVPEAPGDSAAQRSQVVALKAPPAPVLAPPAHPFWDRRNAVLFTGVALSRGLDFASTRNMRARGRQEILLSNNVVDNLPAFAAIEAAAAGASIGLSRWMHSRGHHRLERWVSIIHIGVATAGSVRNYALKSGRHLAPAP